MAISLTAAAQTQDMLLEAFAEATQAKVWPPLRCTQTYWTVTLSTAIALYEPEGISHMTLKDLLTNDVGESMRAIDIVELMETLEVNGYFEGRTIEGHEYAVALDHGGRRCLLHSK